MTDTATLTTWGPLAQPLHLEVPDDPRPWRDNAFFCFWDPSQDLCGVMHVSTSPNAPGGRRARVTVKLEDTTVEVIETPDLATWNTESITFDPASGFTIDSPELSGTITGTPLHGLAAFAGPDSPTGLSLDDDHPVHHYQRGAIVTGQLTVKGTTVDVNGWGYRDRTWGFREESASLDEYWGVMWVFPDFSISALTLRGQDGKSGTIGFVLRADGSTDRITKTSISRDAAGLFVGTRLDTAGGDTLEIRSLGRVATFWCPLGQDQQNGPTLSAYDEFGALGTADGIEGFGLLEQGITRKLV